EMTFSAASLIKIPILVHAIKLASQDAFPLDREVIVRNITSVKGAGVLRHLHDGLVLTMKDLLTLMIIVSDNTATNMVIDLLGMDGVNETSKELGIKNSFLRRRMMDRTAIEQGIDNTCTASDMTNLLLKIAHREAVGEHWDDIMLQILRAQQFGDRLDLILPSDVMIANKTGARTGIVHDCGIITTSKFSYSICVLTSDLKSNGHGVMAVAEISRHIYNYVSCNVDDTCRPISSLLYEENEENIS
ncbi:MAG: serine hydrolase, partial [Armatimonadota bacterium]